MGVRGIKYVASFLQGLHRFDPILPIFERYLASKVYGCECLAKPVFILGAPRSGTTFLYELLNSQFNTVYFSNLSSLLYKTPLLADWLCHDRNNKGFRGKSSYGYVDGICSPSEARAIFDYWLGKVDNNSIDRDNTNNDFAAAVSRLEQRTGRVFVAKNLNNIHRIDQLKKIFPDAIYLWIKRDPSFVAQSILIARMNLFSNESAWFSVRPKDYQKLSKLEPEEQIAWQIRFVDEEIESKLDSHASLFEVSYHDLCSSPETELNRIREFCIEKGVGLSFRQGRVMPHAVTSDQIRLELSQFEKLRATVDNIVIKR